MLRLIKKADATSARLTILPTGSLSIELVFTPSALSDIIISTTPKIFTDLLTIMKLNDGSIDFSYDTDDFIITRDTDVIPSYA